MAGGQKKRKSSKSPSRGASKRVRRSLINASSQSQEAGLDLHRARAKSVFRGDKDPYFPLEREHERATSLPTGDDWAFRIKVISSSTDLDEDVFKKAIQGLVKICFPNGVLDELGIRVVKQHMQEEGASEENIARMTEIFGSEMIHRIGWMLAEYLDTPSRVETGVQSIIAASAMLHGNKLGSDVLDSVVAGLHRLRERVPADSTARLASNNLLEIAPSENDSDGDNNTNSGQDVASIEHPLATRKTKKRDRSKRKERVTEANASEIDIDESAPIPMERKKRNKKDRSKRHEVAKDQVLEGNESERDIDGPAATQPAGQTPEPPRELRDNKISSKWKWEVDPTDLTSEGVLKCFERTSDLFAFHALPIAKRKLGPNARKKEIRHEMEIMLADMHDEEHDKWVESFQKLLAGDKEMLVRPQPQTMFSNRRRSAATPAPIDAQKRAEKAVKAVGEDSHQHVRNRNRVSTLSQRHTTIKREVEADMRVSAEPSYAKAQQDDVAAATTAFRHLSTEEPDPDPPVSNMELPGGRGSESFQSGQKHTSVDTSKPHIAKGDADVTTASWAVETPIIDLLWGRAHFELNARTKVVGVIMNKLNHRKVAQSIGVQLLSCATKVVDKATLKARLSGRNAPNAPQRNVARVREYMERQLIPWVVSSPSSFPELLAEPFVFINMMPSTTCVSSSRTLYAEIREILETIKHSDEVKRGLLERTFRHLALAHRTAFADLKSSLLIRTWERETGQQW